MNKVKFIKIKIILLGLFILGITNIPYVSFAETQIEVQEGEINVETSPNNPQPYQDVTITLSSYATDLNKAIITWKTAAVTVLSGIGKTSYSFKTGKSGSINVFDITITPVGTMNTINKQVAIVPSEIDILWESVDGYVPPFYKGKALPTSGGFIRVVAIPNTSTIKSGNGSITYEWKNSGEVVLNASGYNKNSYEFKNSMFNDVNEITVVASSVGSSYGAENTIEIPIYKPKIIFYKKSPTEGILYSNALSKEVAMPEDEMTIIALPYFLPTKGNENNLSYSWKINGKSITTPTKKEELTVRPTSRDGYATIDVVIENLGELFQKISNQLKINL